MVLLFRSLETIIEQDLRTGGEFQLTDGLQLMIDAGEPMEVFNVAEDWLDCGTPGLFWPLTGIFGGRWLCTLKIGRMS